MPFSGDALPFAKEALQFSAKCGCDIGPSQRIGHIGGEEAGLRPAIEPLALEFESIERLLAGQFIHRIGKLDFSSGATLLVGQDPEDLRLEDVATSDNQIR